MHLPLLGEVDGIERKNTLYENCQYFLNSEELTEWARVRQDAYKETAKADRLVARAYLRSVLARYSGDMESANGVFLSSKELVKEPQSLQLGANAHGKPRLYTEASQKRVPGNCGAPSRLEFNLSHSHGIIGVAVSYMDSVGLDVEHGKRKMKKDVDMKLARRYFSPTEQEMLQGTGVACSSMTSDATKEIFTLFLKKCSCAARRGQKRLVSEIMDFEGSVCQGGRERNRSATRPKIIFFFLPR